MAARMSKSPLAVAQMALQVGNASFPPFSHRNSRKEFTQAQLFALLMLRQFFRVDFRGLVAILKDSRDLRDALALCRVPHYSTLCYAQARLLKKTDLNDVSALFLSKLSA